MLLKDLNIPELPTNVLMVFRDAIRDELQARKLAYHIYRKTHSHPPVVREYDWKEETQKILKENSLSLLGMPENSKRNNYRNRAKYLPCLLGQNWDLLFPFADTTAHNCYVYAHIDPRGKLTVLEGLHMALKGDPFYIGKGSGTRAFDLKRNQGHGKRIKLIREAGFPDSSISFVIQDSLTELEALTLEAKLIYYFGSIYDETINGCLLNLSDHVKPVFIKSMTKLPKRKNFNSQIHRSSSSNWPLARALTEPVHKRSH